MASFEPHYGLTRHAERRCQGRGISAHLVEAILVHADMETPVGGGCISLMVSRRKLDRLADPVLSPTDRDRMGHIAVIVCEEDRDIVTVIHVYRRKSRRYSRRMDAHHRGSYSNRHCRSEDGPVELWPEHGLEDACEVTPEEARQF